MSTLPSEKKAGPESLGVALLGGLLLASRLLKIPRPASTPPHPSSSSMNDSSYPTADASAADEQTTSDSSQAGTATAAATAADETSAAEQSAENNPLKRFQDLINSPATPDGHKVVAAVAAASTVTVAAVANWLIKATKK